MSAADLMFAAAALALVAWLYWYAGTFLHRTDVTVSEAPAIRPGDSITFNGRDFHVVDQVDGNTVTLVGGRTETPAADAAFRIGTVP